MYGENLEWWERWSMSQLTFCRFWVLHKPLEESSVAGTWPSGWTDPIKENEWISVEIQKTLAAFSARPQGVPEVKGLSRVQHDGMCLPSCETELTVGIFAREESRGATQNWLVFLLFPKWKTASSFYHNGAVQSHLNLPMLSMLDWRSIALPCEELDKKRASEKVGGQPLCAELPYQNFPRSQVHTPPTYERLRASNVLCWSSWKDKSSLLALTSAALYQQSGNPKVQLHQITPWHHGIGSSWLEASGFNAVRWNPPRSQHFTVLPKLPKMTWLETHLQHEMMHTKWMQMN